MTRPIRAIQAGAARIGEGSLDERIEVHTGDELESLADEFNRMAARLGDSYETLEQRVEDRTRDLLEALSQLERVSGEKTPLPGQHVPRAAHASERHHQLRRRAARRLRGRPHRAPGRLLPRTSTPRAATCWS